MYYETREHAEKQVGSAYEAAELIKSGSAQSWEAITWKTEHGKFFAVADSHIDDSSAFAETAIIKQVENSFIRIESITVAWIKTTAEVARYFLESETSDIHSLTTLIIGRAKDQVAYFTCGCCGTSFKSNVKKQLKFDQDTGYGICPGCEQSYYN